MIDVVRETRGAHDNRALADHSIGERGPQLVGVTPPSGTEVPAPARLQPAIADRRTSPYDVRLDRARHVVVPAGPQATFSSRYSA